MKRIITLSVLAVVASVPLLTGCANLTPDQKASIRAKHYETIEIWKANEWVIGGVLGFHREHVQEW